MIPLLLIFAQADTGWVADLAKSVGPSASIALAFIAHLHFKDKSDAKRAKEKEKAENDRQTLFFEAMERIGDKCHAAHRDQANTFIEFQKEQQDAMLKSRGQLAEVIDRSSKALGRVGAILDRHETRRGATG